MDFSRDTWMLDIAPGPDPYAIHCAVCAKGGSWRRRELWQGTEGRLWCCWECRDVIVAHKALNGAHLTATEYGPHFSDGAVYWGFFAD